MSVATQTHGGYLIRGDKNFPAMKRILPDGKGSVPQELTGIYTGFREAKEAIDQRAMRLQKVEEEKAAQKKAKRVRLKMEEPDAPEADTTLRDEPVHEGANN